MTEPYNIEGELLALVAFGVMVVALTIVLRVLQVSWVKVAVAVSSVIVLTIGMYLPLENATVALCLACIPIVFILTLFPEENELQRLWWRMTGDQRAITTPELVGTASIVTSLKEKMDRVLADGGHARAQVNQAIALKNLGRGPLVHGREHPQVRHHKDAIDRQAGDAFGLERIDEHGAALCAAGRVREYAAAAH